MSRTYDMIVETQNVKADRIEQIQSACCAEWPFKPDDFCIDVKSDETRDLTARAIGDLCDGEYEQNFADRVAVAIWKANEGYCPITVESLYLDDQPFEEHDRDEEDYQRLMGMIVKEPG